MLSRWCNLSLILGAFYPTNVFLLLIYYSFFIQHNLSGRKSNSSGRAGDFGKFASKREISRPVGVSAEALTIKICNIEQAFTLQSMGIFRGSFLCISEVKTPEAPLYFFPGVTPLNPIFTRVPEHAIVDNYTTSTHDIKIKKNVQNFCCDWLINLLREW